jgi:hypothetical protein
MIVRDSKNAVLDGITSSKPFRDAPMIRLERSPGAVVRNGRAAEGTSVFVSVPPGERADVAMENNHVGGDTKALEEWNGLGR